MSAVTRRNIPEILRSTQAVERSSSMESKSGLLAFQVYRAKQDTADRFQFAELGEYSVSTNSLNGIQSHHQKALVEPSEVRGPIHPSQVGKAICSHWNTRVERLSRCVGNFLTANG